MTREFRAAGDRFETLAPGIRTRHSFSYGHHYDPANVGFGPIIAVNEESLEPGAGYDRHRHADVEIVTWVLRGVLDHQDSTGPAGTIEPGLCQRLSAGDGAEHIERNGSSGSSLRFVQTMLRSSHEGPPEYDAVRIGDEDGLHRGVRVHADARLSIARVGAAGVVVPPASWTLIHVTRGHVVIDGVDLVGGDQVRCTDSGPISLSGSGEAMVWTAPSAGVQNRPSSTR